MKHIPLSLALVSLLTLVACGKAAPVPGATGTGAKVTETKEQLEARATAGDADAQFELGAMYHDGQGGLVKDLAKAKQWLEKSAAQNNELAQFNLGVMYYTGEGMNQDYARAQQWFDKAAGKGNMRAQFNLGVMNYRGEGMKQDFSKAFDLFTKSAKQGFNEAAFNLGVMYAKGEGTLPDVAQAYAWFSVADAFRNERASEVIKEIEHGLTADQLSLVKDLAKQTLNEVNNNIAAATAKAQGK